jgi:aspartate aminotransferase
MTAFQAVLAQRVRGVGESKTIGVFSLARELRRQGRQIFSLAVGEPAFDTPQAVIDATRRALTEQQTRYSAVAGLETLRERLAESFEGYGAENILVANGAKQALFSIFQVLCDPADEVIVPQPCWVSFCEQIKLAGGRPVPVATIDHQLDPAAIEKAVNRRTKAILVNTPNNPTGAVYPRERLAEVAEIAASHGLYLISDEAYHLFTYDGLPHVPMREVAADRDRVITVRSFSKHYNMTGFRLGYVAAHEAVIAALTRLQSHLSGNVCTFAQYGGLGALQMDQGIVEERRRELERRRDLAYELTRELFECVKPQGAFYLFADARAHLGAGESSEDLAMRLLDRAGVAVVPGEAFGGPGHIRIAFGAAETEMRAAFDKIKEVL